MGELFHECGVAAIYHAPGASNSRFLPDPSDINSVSLLIPRMLLDMQNRGQLAAGMTSYKADEPWILRTHKELGMVADAFKLNRKPKYEKIMEGLTGSAAIGHVRYATSGGEDKSMAQPFERDHGRRSRWFAFAFNGQIANYDLLKEELFKGDYHLKRDTDTEIILHSLSQEIHKEPDVVDWKGVFSRLAKRFDGSYNIVLLSASGDMIVARDPLGFRPLCYARDGAIFGAASESVALSNLGFDEIHSLKPGHLAVVNAGGVRIEEFADSFKRAHCFFEWIYFANAASTLDDRSVYLSRTELGRALAELEIARGTELCENTIVVPVPDTAKAAADAMAHALKIPSREGLMRNRNLGRTFIEGDANREAKAKLKYTPLPEVLKGKKVILVEDSVVRSTTMRALVHEIRDRGGAQEIHLRVACPPIIAPCFYGIDMPSERDLFAPKFIDMPNRGVSLAAQDRMAAKLEVDSLRYLPLDAIARSINKGASSLCQACLTAEYPTPSGERLYQLDLSGKRSVRTC